MLLILTGDIQIGKTRWLARAVKRLQAGGVGVDGVLAPGVWQRHEDGSFEKRGIDNVLLPEGRRVPFARRADLARAAGAFDAGAQAARAGLGWHISDEAIAQVNAHFDRLMEDAGTAADVGQGNATKAPAEDKRDTAAENSASGERKGPAEALAADGRRPTAQRLLVVDELGRLELLRNGGLTSAMALLARGPQGRYAHAVVIVRDNLGLPDRAEERFAAVWGGAARISPTEDAWRTWLEPLLDTNAR